jgi:hypothetical protein
MMIRPFSYTEYTLVLHQSDFKVYITFESQTNDAYICYLAIKNMKTYTFLRSSNRSSNVDNTCDRWKRITKKADGSHLALRFEDSSYSRDNAHHGDGANNIGPQQKANLTAATE